jgi:predicted esterase YcpF (UPF0227 family)
MKNNAEYLYLHGFNSSGSSIKFKRLKKFLFCQNIKIICPNLPFCPSAAIKQIEIVIKKKRIVKIIGSSLGGFYAIYFGNKLNIPIMAINPALEPDKSLMNYIGPQKNIYTKKKYILKKEHLYFLSKIKQSKIKNKRTTLLLQSRDFFKGCKSIFINNGNHGLEDLSNLEYLACL